MKNLYKFFTRNSTREESPTDLLRESEMLCVEIARALQEMKDLMTLAHKFDW